MPRSDAPSTLDAENQLLKKQEQRIEETEKFQHMKKDVTLFSKIQLFRPVSFDLCSELLRSGSKIKDKKTGHLPEQS